jgi:hypothetical protein
VSSDHLIKSLVMALHAETMAMAYPYLTLHRCDIVRAVVERTEAARTQRIRAQTEQAGEEQRQRAA